MNFSKCLLLTHLIVVTRTPKKWCVLYSMLSKVTCGSSQSLVLWITLAGSLRHQPHTYNCKCIQTLEIPWISCWDCHWCHVFQFHLWPISNKIQVVVFVSSHLTVKWIRSLQGIYICTKKLVSQTKHCMHYIRCKTCRAETGIFHFFELALFAAQWKAVSATHHYSFLWLHG